MRSAGMRLARTQWAPLTALAVLMLVSALLAVVVPSRTTAGYDRAAAAAAGPGAVIRVKGTAGGTAAFAAVPGEAALNGNALTWRELMPRSLSEGTGEPEASVTSPADTVEGACTVRGSCTWAGNRTRGGASASSPAASPPTSRARRAAT